MQSHTSKEQLDFYAQIEYYIINKKFDYACSLLSSRKFEATFIFVQNARKNKENLKDFARYCSGLKKFELAKQIYLSVPEREKDKEVLLEIAYSYAFLERTKKWY